MSELLTAALGVIGTVGAVLADRIRGGWDPRDEVKKNEDVYRVLPVSSKAKAVLRGRFDDVALHYLVDGWRVGRNYGGAALALVGVVSALLLASLSVYPLRDYSHYPWPLWAIAWLMTSFLITVAYFGVMSAVPDELRKQLRDASGRPVRNN